MIDLAAAEQQWHDWIRDACTAVDVELHPGSNLFVGSNGQGKTNLVEALGYLSTLGSHRVSVDHAMIRQGQESAIIRARLAFAGREILAVGVLRSLPEALAVYMATSALRRSSSARVAPGRAAAIPMLTPTWMS